MPPYFFHVYRDHAARWRWTLWSWNNREKLADSGQSFTTQQSCERNIDLIRRVAPVAPIRYVLHR